MKLARVVGNVVSTVKDACYTGQKLMIIDYIDENGSLTGNQAIAARRTCSSAAPSSPI